MPKTHFYLLISFLVTLSLLICLSLFTTYKNIPQPVLVTNQKKITSSPFPSPTPFLTGKVFSPDDKNYAYLEYIQSSNSYTIKVHGLTDSLVDKDDPSVISQEVWDKRNQDWSKSVDYTPSVKDIAWSPASDKLAVFLPGRMKIFYLKKYPGMTHNYRYESRQIAKTSYTLVLFR